MREFKCPHCGQLSAFEASECNGCTQPLMFDPENMAMIGVKSAIECVNRNIIGCNWCAVATTPYCLSCSLTQVIPSTQNTQNVSLWTRVEEAKRRLIYDLRRLRLPIAFAGGFLLAFEILSDEHGPILTGHESGLITINLAEADDVQREIRRVSFREPYRTLLGHFRHEIGHFYWNALIHEGGFLSPFRLVFGDETENTRLRLLPITPVKIGRTIRQVTSACMRHLTPGKTGPKPSPTSYISFRPWIRWQDFRCLWTRALSTR